MKAQINSQSWASWASKLVALVILSNLHSAQASAACTSPAGNEGDVFYSSPGHVMVYCNSTSWIGMGSNSSVGFGTLTTGDICTATSSSNVSCTTAGINLATQVAGVLGGTYGGTGVNNGANTITLAGNVTTSGAFPLTLTTTASTNVTLPTSGTLITSAVTALPGLVTIGTVTTGTWNSTIISPTYGGTGINNGTNTITVAGNLTTAGAFPLTLTATGTTSVTLPTSGTLVNAAVTALSSLATVGTITSGTWNGAIITPTYGGLGNNFSASTGALYDVAGTISAGNLPTTYGGLGGNFGASSGALSISAGTVTAGTLNVSNGGTGSSTAALARSFTGLNIEGMTTISTGSTYSIQSSDRTVALNTTLISSTSWTLPNANSVNPGQQICVVDKGGGISAADTLTINRNGSDTINGGTSTVLNAAYQGLCLVSDGSSKWTTPQLPASDLSGSYVSLQTSTPGTQQTGNMNVSGTGIFSGKIGIGTTSPANPLQVVGGISSSGNSGAYAGAGAGAAISMYENGTTGNIASATSGSSWNPLVISAASISLLSNGSTQGLYQDLSGNVGIGTTGPGYPLDVQTSTGTPLNLVNNAVGSYVGVLQAFAPNITASQDTYIEVGKTASTNNMASFGFTYAGSGSTSNRADIGFWGGSPLLSVLASGNVGIGTTSPTVPLYIQGPTITTSSTTYVPTVRLFGPLSGGSDRSIDMGAYQFSTYIQSWDTGTGDALLINPIGGNVGIGTTSPSHALQVQGSFNGDGISVSVGTSANAGGILLYQYGTSAYGGMGLSNAASQWFGGAVAGDVSLFTSASNALIFGTNSVERMRISSGGNVGIGSTSPGSPLVVVGTGGVAAGPATLATTTTSDGATVWAMNSLDAALTAGASPTHGLVHVIGEANSPYNSGYVGFRYVGAGSTNNYMTLSMYGVDNILNVTGAGYVGIGTTSPSSLLDVVGASGAGSPVGTVETLGTTYSDRPAFLLKSPSYNGYINLEPNTGNLNFGTQSANHVTIGSTGLVGIGTTSSTGILTVTGAGDANNYGGIIRIFNTGSQLWGGVTFPDTLSGTTNTNYYMIGRASGLSSRVLSVHLPTAGDYGSGSQPTFGVYSTGATKLFEVEASTARAYFGGNVGIGTTVPSTLLDVNGYSQFRNTTYFHDVSGNVPTSAMAVYGYNSGSNPFLVIAAQTYNSPGNYSWVRDAMDIYSTGNVTIAGTLTQSSDRRLKTNIHRIEDALGKIQNLNGVIFRWKDKKRDPAEQIGVIAQDVETSFPQAVGTDNGGFKTVNYSGLVAPLIEAVKELKSLFDRDHDRLAKLEADNDNLRATDAAAISELRQEFESYKKAHPQR